MIAPHGLGFGLLAKAFEFQTKGKREMAVDFSKPVQTRAGNKVRVLCADMKNKEYTIAALVTLSDGSEEICTFYKDGRHLGMSGGVSHNDLVNVTEKRWVNLYFTNRKIQIGGLEFDTQQEAVEAATISNGDGNVYLKTVEVELPS